MGIPGGSPQNYRAQTMTQSPSIQEVFIYLCVSDPGAAIEFYKEVFGAEELMRLTEANGEIAHAEIKIGPATVMLSGEYPDWGIHSPEFYGGTPARVHLHVDDVDSLSEAAKKAGAEILVEPSDQPHGERHSKFRDPFGHEWLLGHEIERLTAEEMQQRLNKTFEE